MSKMDSAVYSYLPKPHLEILIGCKCFSNTVGGVGKVVGSQLAANICLSNVQLSVFYAALVSYKSFHTFPHFHKMNTMELSKALSCAGLILLMLIFPTVFSCDRCLHKSKVAYYSSSQPLNGGACGYESFAVSFKNGDVATASSKIFRDGIGCGGCFQIRCTDPAICSKSGVKVVVSDLTRNNQTDFVLPVSTFSKMAQPRKSSKLVTMGVVDIEYKRIPCEYPGKNMMVKIDKISNYPYFLAVQFLYQGGQTDIMGVEVAPVGSSNWRSMTRNHGAVWSMQQPPSGDKSLRILVTSGYDGFWVWAKGAVVPSDWKVDSIYDSGVQIKEIAQEGCSPCDSQDWGP